MEFKLDLSSLQNAVKDLSTIISDGEKTSKREYPFTSFKSKNNNARIGVVDGSHHNINGANSVFSTIRSGYQIYRDNELIEESIDPISVELITNTKDFKTGYIAKHESYFTRVTDEIPNGDMEFDKVTERIRTLLEWEKIKQLVDKLQAGDIVLFDGSLMSGVISTSSIFFEKLSSRAKNKGVSLIGLSKDTSLSIESVPVPFVLLEAAKNQHPNKNWFVPLNDTYFVKFRPNHEQVFRLDAVLPENTTIDSVIKRLGSYCYAAGMEGYPYPLQFIHDAVIIDEMQRNQCFSLFQEECLKSNISRRYFEQMFSIYHDQLDQISYGR